MVPHAPHLLLETLAFRGDSQRFTLAAGGAARVGRTALSDFVVLGDEQLSGAHFEITWDGQGASVRDLGSATGTLVEGRRAEVAEVRHGGWIRAGNTDFRAYVEGFSGGRARAGGVSGAGGAAGSGGAAGAGGAAGVLRRLLSREGERAFAVVDAARSPRALELLKESVDAHTSLFDGAPGEALSRVAPYLVELAPERSMLLERLAGEGWGLSWGVYVLSNAPLRELRRRLRRHLRVEDPDGRPMFFRFYDPRVLGRFLPMASERQREELFADVSRFVVEAASGGEARVFSREGGELACEVHGIAGAREVA